MFCAARWTLQAGRPRQSGQGGRIGRVILRGEPPSITNSRITLTVQIGYMFGPSLGGLLHLLAGFPLPFWVSGGLAGAVAGLALLLLSHQTSQAEQLGDTRQDT